MSIDQREYRYVGTVCLMNFGVEYTIHICHGSDGVFYFRYMIPTQRESVYNDLFTMIEKYDRYINWEKSDVSDEDQKKITSYLVMEAL